MKSGTPRVRGESPDGLTISDLAAATGVNAATLRTWETRHGYPRPVRLPGGHRRYRQQEVATISDIERRRAAGQTLPSAIAAAITHLDHPASSVFAELRRRHSGLAPRAVRRETLLALTRAIEDECCARAEAPLLFGAFQHERFYEPSRRRWAELARTADSAVVFADFEKRQQGSSPRHVPIPADSPLLREWVVVCDALDYPACVAAWELMGPDESSPRWFEVIWTVDPQVVRTASRICVGLMRPGAHRDRLQELVSTTPVPPSPDLARAQGLLERTLVYVDGRE